MTKKQVSLCEGLKRLGFKSGNQIKLYGTVFELVRDPIVMGDTLVLADVIERNSGRLTRVRIPPTLVNKAIAGTLIHKRLRVLSSKRQHTEAA